MGVAGAVLCVLSFGGLGSGGFHNLNRNGVVSSRDSSMHALYLLAESSRFRCGVEAAVRQSVAIGLELAF